MNKNLKKKNARNGCHSADNTHHSPHTCGIVEGRKSGLDYIETKGDVNVAIRGLDPDARVFWERWTMQIKRRLGRGGVFKFFLAGCMQDDKFEKGWNLRGAL